MSVTVDVSQVNNLARNLSLVGRELDDKVSKVVYRGGMNIKREWAANARAVGHIGSRLAGSLNVDVQDGGRAAEIEALGGGAAFGAIIEYGTATSPPRDCAKRALDKEAPRFEKALEKVAADVLK